jgi:hypothetical protein
MMRSVVVLAFATALLARPAPAHACSCSRPGVEVSPTAGVPAPLNAVVRVTWPTDVTLDEATVVLVVRGKQAKADAKKDAKKDRKKAPPAPPDTPIEVDRVKLQQGNVHILLLTPRQPLLPETQYAVLAASAAGGKAAVIGELKTGKDTDTAAPEWAGVARATYLHVPAVCCNCSTGDPYAQVELTDRSKTTDDLTPADAVVYGLWPADATVDRTTPPLVIIKDWSGKLFFGHKSKCSPANFVFPALKKGQSSYALQIAPIDLAGNVGKPAPITLELLKPVTKAP